MYFILFKFFFFIYICIFQIFSYDINSFCNLEDISLFQLLELPSDGSVYQHIQIKPRRYMNDDDQTSFFEKSDCIHDNNYYKCKIQFLREYLPTKRYFLNKLQYQRITKCDEIFSKVLTYWMKTYARIVVRPGYPYTKYMEKVSIGKYIRINSVIQFHLFHGLSTDHLIDFYYTTELGWPWTDLNDNCIFPYVNWNCAFMNFSDISIISIPTENDFTLLNDITKEDVFNLRNIKDNDNHIFTILLYGRLLNILSEPNPIMKDYFLRNVISLNPRAIYKDYIPNIENPEYRTFNSFYEFEQMTKDLYAISSDVKEMVTSVTMHVRQGDACDRIIDHEIFNTSNFKTGTRPCFHVNVYMQKLKLLRSLYNVKRVYLVTDSEDMIERTRIEPDFNWVYINVSRNFLDHGLGWIEYRKDELNANIMNSTIADMILMKYGDIFLGAYTSHFSKSAFYSMCGHSMRLVPFVSLDYPLTCDYNEYCEDGGYNMTVEDMINHIPGLRYNADFINIGEDD